MNDGRPADPTLFATACVLGLVGVAAGAFGAHALRDAVTPERLETFRTGVSYQLFHAPVVLFAGFHAHTPLRRWAARVIAAGVVVFSGSLYLLVLLDLPWMGAITPLGGVWMIVGWAMLAWSARAS